MFDSVRLVSMISYTVNEAKQLSATELELPCVVTSYGMPAISMVPYEGQPAAELCEHVPLSKFR